jgi:hypothetical protein
MLEMSRILPILCQFGVGGLLGAIGLWAGFSSGYLDLKQRHHRHMLAVLLGGYVLLLAVSCAFTFWLPFAAAEATP